jgi:hypothetical protein
MVFRTVAGKETCFRQMTTNFQPFFNEHLNIKYLCSRDCKNMICFGIRKSSIVERNSLVDILFLGKDLIVLQYPGDQAASLKHPV